MIDRLPNPYVIRSQVRFVPFYHSRPIRTPIMNGISAMASCIFVVLL